MQSSQSPARADRRGARSSSAGVSAITGSSSRAPASRSFRSNNNEAGENRRFGRPAPRGGRVSLPSDARRSDGREVISGRNGRVKQFIDPKRFVQEATIAEKAEYIPQHDFSDFAVHPRILENIRAKGYEKPSPIQDKTIPLVLEGRDVVGIANTGTGKTAAFSLPMINDLIRNMEHRCLIMAPTRELAQQIQEEILAFSKNTGIRTALLIGGASMNIQVRDLKRSPRIIIGTPGRIKDHLQQKTLSLSTISFAVLDEFDRMLDMGFIRDITSIFALMPKQRQTLFFSATVDDKIESQIRNFARDPVTVSVKEGVTADSVKQDVVFFRQKEEKIDLLHDLLISDGRGKTIIFDDTKRLVEKLGRELVARGFRVDQIHGNKSQAQRSRAIKRLKTNEIDILVATDVAARGIDVSDISHVINYSQPSTYDDYVHRIGRTGRAGKTGRAFTFVQK